MTAKERLLGGAIDYIATNGAADLSLRQVAKAIGTSHRMLIYHFASKEGLLIEVVRAVEERQRMLFAELNADESTDVGEMARRFWQRLSAAENWPYVRLLFEIYGRALQGDQRSRPLLDGLVESWLPPLTEWGIQRGLPPEKARAYARLGVAVPRGLLLDLMATGDKAAVDEAMDLFITSYETLLS
ncbi:TetR/AcrR family transcriptional regulator [Fodinicola feengrottensis]|uniref:TetR/AcrR family transcriptional regulator n=1 Tax=Fodinicola feengrottensis TaxID=435914 RepID=A0ABN2G4Y7_9ACTN|nr:TetR/AcrR family transcriptional regulator [Fodinicola feengrottensis]